MWKQPQKIKHMKPITVKIRSQIHTNNAQELFVGNCTEGFY